ncbi:MAG: SDR family NAD(P)-dependent oxidoreductase [Pseudomonadota bacterium]
MLAHKQKTFIVTGANTGIGYETAKAFGKLGAKVIVAVRDPEKGHEAVGRLQDETKSNRFVLQVLDLADLSSIRLAAESLASEERIDVLVNNAGLGSVKEGTTKDGFELVMGTNHLGTFALTTVLMQKLKETAQTHGEARIINLSSMAHQFARKFDPKDLLPAKRGTTRDAYAESKLCNLLHARELARRYGRSGIRAHAVHPGFVKSDFGRSENFPGAWQMVFKLTTPLQISPAKGAATTVTAAISDEAAWNNGFYWDKSKPATPTLPAKPDAVAKAMWEETERLLASKGFIYRDDEPDEDTPRTPPVFPDGL